MLTAKLQKIIQGFVERTFENLRLNLLGPSSIKGKALTFSFKNYDPKTTLTANYLASNAITSIDVKSIDKSTIKKISTVAEHYIDSIEQKTLADVNRVIGEKYDDLNLQAKIKQMPVEDLLREQVGQSILKDIGSQLKVQKDRLDKAVDQLVNHELHNSQNAGALDGILGMSKALGIDDPQVFKIGVLDAKRCKYCWALWTMEDKVTPRVYRLSELSGTAGDNYKNPNPSVSPTHINCRDVLTVLLPGFSFDKTGNVIYVGNEHDEHVKQRS